MAQTYSKAALDLAVQNAVAAERNRCAKLVPTNWCDALLTGTLPTFSAERVMKFALSILGRTRPVPQPRMIPNPLYCETCEGRGYVVADAEWEPYAVQCPDCADRRPAEPKSKSEK